MIPSLDDRLDSVVRALQEVILPALDAHQSLAIEQAHLSLAHIGIIRQQLDDAPPFERDEAESFLALARDLLGAADGGQATLSAAKTLRSAVDAATLDSPAAVRRATHEVGSAIEALIQASCEDATEAFRTASLEQVLASGRTSALANRRWNLAAGFEPPEAAVAEASRT